MTSLIHPSSTVSKSVKIGDNVTMGAGSVFNKDIPDNSLSIGRSYQINKKKITKS